MTGMTCVTGLFYMVNFKFQFTLGASCSILLIAKTHLI